MSLPPFLDEQGLVISLDRLTINGKSYRWREMGIVRIMRKGNVITKLVSPTYALVVSTKANPAPVTVFETKDADLKDRIELVINQVVGALGAKREL